VVFVLWPPLGIEDKHARVEGREREREKERMRVKETEWE
jgi:hypothetical protein